MQEIAQQRKQSLSARRAWIEIKPAEQTKTLKVVALRKESVDRNSTYVIRLPRCQVALRKESVDRNRQNYECFQWIKSSLSARRAWIEINVIYLSSFHRTVALRKESVDRNNRPHSQKHINRGVALRKESVDRNTSIDNLTQGVFKSLSARRAWIEIVKLFRQNYECFSRSPQGERG